MKDMLCDFGMPVRFKNSLYNCRVFVANGEVIAIRPKTSLAVAGNYRENRWFNEWKYGRKVFDFDLPEVIKQ